MADFCKQCSEEIFDEDFGDLKGLVKGDAVCRALCEGCGNCTVNADGRCVSMTCLKKHGEVDE